MPDTTTTTTTYVGTAQYGKRINPKTIDMALNAGHAAKEARKKAANDKDGKDKKC
ncbi:hypothetical protein BHE90_003739 [Fusarium euwallaceae]|uniref:Uncharacterized protein n=1 Tax=Fusarium euwallaceae TaxID=1147111 RepID=A0A430M1A0_9HYPO|nr:hypothetical protein BHE90_003739 [Fusarium euwallaceae]